MEEEECLLKPYLDLPRLSGPEAREREGLGTGGLYSRTLNQRADAC